MDATRKNLTFIVLALVLLTGSVAAQDEEAEMETAEEAAEVKEPPSLLGEVSREEIEAAEPTWLLEEHEVDAEAAHGLAAVEPGTRVVVYFGTWCSDSAREVSRFWQALDEAMMVEPPFEVTYVAVDRSDKRPPELLEKLDLRYVPTFIVWRDGREVGRMVEVSPNGIEVDLLALLTGEAEGVVSARDDLGGDG